MNKFYDGKKGLLSVLFIVFLSIYQNVTANDVVAGAYYVSTSGSDNNDGKLVNEGGSGPWLTIQHAAQTLVAGEIVYVREGIYSEPDPIDGSTKIWGIRPKNSGSAGNYISYVAYPDERVVLDTNFESPCITLYGIKYVQIKGFEIRNCNGSGIWVKSGSGTENSNLILDENLIHGIDGGSGSNVAGIRMDYVGHSTISNNIIYNIRVAGEHNGNAAGVLSYEMHNVIIENNEFFDSYSGIFHKTPADSTQKSGVFRKNLIHDTDRAIYFNTNETVPITGFHNGTEVYNNVVYNSGLFIYDHSYQSKAQSTGLKVYNNTVIGADFGIRGFDKVEFYNNILVDKPGINTYYQEHVFTDPGTRKAPGLILSDYNLYFPNFVAQVGVYSNEKKVFNSLSEWQVSGFDGALFTIDVSAPGPDEHSAVEDPLFINKEVNNYRLQPQSPAKTMGINGGVIGAYITDNDVIGPEVSRFLIPPAAPVLEVK